MSEPRGKHNEKKKENNKQETEIIAACRYSSSVTAQCSANMYTAIHDDTQFGMEHTAT
jgi:hypothetical protein